MLESSIIFYNEIIHYYTKRLLLMTFNEGFEDKREHYLIFSMYLRCYSY